MSHLPESSGQDRAVVSAGSGRTVLPVTPNGKRGRSIWKWARWLAVAIAVGCIIYLLVWYVPDVLARRNANSSVESAWIGAVFGFLGLVATAAVAIFAFWYSRLTNQATIEAAKATTDETVKSARETNEATIAAAREGQFPDRYSKAIEQLGSDNLDVRIGGIYALEGIGVDSARHHQTVMEVLTAFIREHSREPWPPPDPGGQERKLSIRPDVQAAVTVVARRDRGRDISGRHIDLVGAVLLGADLVDADLSSANLTGATLTGANLRDANLTEAVLTEAVLTDANLRDATLTSANLTRAVFTGANLRGATLTSADLGGADLTDAKLPGAILTDTNLRLTKLTNAELGGATWPTRTPVPPGWKRDTTMRWLVRADREAGQAEAN